MNVRKYRWSKDYESAEEELIDLLAAKQVSAARWTAEAYHEFPEHIHEYDSRLWCAEGSIKFIVSGQTISLQPGDALELPAGAPHAATAGLSGCAVYEVQTVPSATATS